MPSSIKDILRIVYAQEYPDQIGDLVRAVESWKTTIVHMRDVIAYFEALDFKRCKCASMIGLSIRCIYVLGSQTPVWNSVVKRAHKELLSRGLDADRKLVGLVRKEKDRN